jgi:hypothetical protein
MLNSIPVSQSLEDDLRQFADTKLQQLNLRRQQRRALRDQWEIAKRNVIRPACLTLSSVAKEYERLLSVGFYCIGSDGWDLFLESPRTPQSGTVHLRFTLDLVQGHIVATSDLESEPAIYTFAALDEEAVEDRVRRFFVAFLDAIDAT